MCNHGSLLVYLATATSSNHLPTCQGYSVFLSYWWLPLLVSNPAPILYRFSGNDAVIYQSCCVLCTCVYDNDQRIPTLNYKSTYITEYIYILTLHTYLTYCEEFCCLLVCRTYRVQLTECHRARRPRSHGGLRCRLRETEFTVSVLLFSQ